MGSSASHGIVSDARLRERIRRKVLISKLKYGANLSTIELLDRVFLETDVDSSGNLDFKEFLKVAAIVGIDATIHQVRQVFSRFDVNKDGNISKNEFVGFINKSNMLHEEKNGHEISQFDYEGLDDFRDQLQQVAEEDRSISFLETWDSWQEKSDKWHRKIERATERVAHLRKENLKCSIKRSKRRKRSFLNVEHKELDNLKYFETSAKWSTIEELFDTIRFDTRELFKLCEAFGKSKELPSTNLIEYLISTHPQVQSHFSLVLRLQVLFCNDLGIVDIESLIVGMSKALPSPLSTKLKLFAFANGNISNISCENLHVFLEKEHRHAMAQFALSKSYLMAMDTDGDGQLSVDELSTALQRNKILLTSISRSLPCPLRTMPILKKLKSMDENENNTTGKSWSFATLQDIWDDYKQLDEVTRERACTLSKLQFREFVHRYFCDVDNQPLSEARTLVDALFSALVTSSNKQQPVVDDRSLSFHSSSFRAVVTVDIVDVLQGLVVLLAPSSMELVCFYFGLFDRNNDGGIDEKELELILRMTQQELTFGHTSALRSLNSLELEYGKMIPVDVVLQNSALFSMLHRYFM